MPSVILKPDTSNWIMSSQNFCSVCCSAMLF